MIGQVVSEIVKHGGDDSDVLVADLQAHIDRLDRLGEVLCSYPSLFDEQSLGSRKRNLSSLVALLQKSDLSSFDMFLPTRAILSRHLVMGEVNFYRSMRIVCDEALPPEVARDAKERIDGKLCHCLYTRLAEEVLRHIASDELVELPVRERAVRALAEMWERATYTISSFFPVLEATWEARRGMPVTLGTLAGTQEIFALLEAGCDEQFVDVLLGGERCEREASAFREFLFGTTTEQLERIKQHMAATGRTVVTQAELEAHAICTPHDLARTDSDPALAMFEFFLARHLQAAARRLAKLPGPWRTAEEYVLLHYLRQEDTPRK